MNILFLSLLSPRNINNWSGTLYYIFGSLANNHSVDWEGKDVFDYIGYYRKIHNGHGRLFIPEHYAAMFGEILSARFNGNQIYDVIVARDYYFISHLKTNIPVIYIGDTTFDLFKDYLKISETPFAFITQGNKDNPHLISQHFERADARLSAIHRVSTFYNYPGYFGK